MFTSCFGDVPFGSIFLFLIFFLQNQKTDELVDGPFIFSLSFSVSRLYPSLSLFFPLSAALHTHTPNMLLCYRVFRSMLVFVCFLHSESGLKSFRRKSAPNNPCISLSPLFFVHFCGFRSTKKRRIKINNA